MNAARQTHDPYRCGRVECQWCLEHNASLSVAPERGTKFNKGKPRFSLVPAESLEEIMKVLEAGAVKYGEYNWTKGIPFTEILDAMHRHYLAYSKGEDKDPESGFSHVAHLGANVMFLLWYEKFKPEFDNRFKNPVKKPE